MNGMSREAACNTPGGHGPTLPCLSPHQGKFESRVVIEALGPGRCRHTLEQTIEFKGLWGLGSVAKVGVAQPIAYCASVHSSIAALPRID